MSMRVLSCVAAALLGTYFHGALAVRPAKVDQQQEESEQVEQVEEEQATDEKPKKVLDVQPDPEEEGANMAEVEAPQESAKPETAQVQKSKLVANVQEHQKANNDATSGGSTTDGGGSGSTANRSSSMVGSGVLAKSIMYHLAPVGSSTCDFGVTVTETDCSDVGSSVLGVWPAPAPNPLPSADDRAHEYKIKPGRDYMVAGGLANAPPGCSIHTLMDWSVTYNTDTGGENDGKFQLICHGGKDEIHSVKQGESQCDFGLPIKVDKCLPSINKYLLKVAKDADTAAGAGTANEDAETTAADDTASTFRKLRIGHWEALPPGCSIHTGAGAGTLTEIAFFNTKNGATNDGSYTLMCTGTVVPVR